MWYVYVDDTVLLFAEKSPVNLELRSYIVINVSVQYYDNNSIVVKSLNSTDHNEK